MAVDLALAKQQIRADSADEDALIGTYLAAAKAWVENFTGTKLSRAPVKQYEDTFGCYIALAWGPRPENVSVAYTDMAGAGQTFTDARLVRDRLYSPASGWPVISANTPIVLTYTAGFEETPSDLDAAVLLLTAELYANRESGAATGAVNAAVESLCNPYRSMSV